MSNLNPLSAICPLNPADMIAVTQAYDLPGEIEGDSINA
jgi:hypothetical protein